MIDSLNYVVLNVRVWCMCSGSIPYMAALVNTFIIEAENLLGSLVQQIILIRQAFYFRVCELGQV